MTGTGGTHERWSVPAVERAAPDAASLAAGRKLATPGPWSQTGCSATLVWGQCQGSGKTPYQTSVDLTGPAYRCSCPSRKFPCKHTLALLLLWAHDALPGEGTEASAEATAWAEQRAAKAAKAAEPPAEKPVVDPAAQARRLADRLVLMSNGLDDFGAWLTDVVRGGLVEARRRPWGWWDQAAARLVDAQVPGLADRVRATGSRIHLSGRHAVGEATGDDWTEDLLGELGRWWTAVRAWSARESLDPATAADLRAYLGWATPADDVRAADAVDDVWQVLGAHRSDDGRLQTQRTWLLGERTGETVLLLDYAGGGGPLPAARLVGSRLSATVARYPGSSPRRALFATEPVLAGTDAALPSGVGLAAAGDLLAELWAGNPWAERVPVVLDGVTLVPDVDVGLVLDADGACVRMLPDAGFDPWPLFAVAGGRPARVFGELEPSGFRALTLDGSDHDRAG